MSVSSASQTVSSQLSGTGPSFLGQPDCTMSNIRFFWWTCTLIILFFCLMSFVSQLCHDSALYASKRGCKFTQRTNQEDFTQEKSHDYSPISKMSLATYQSIPLTSPDTEDSAPSNLLFGQANRYVSTNDDDVTLTIEINANLYVLNGNVFQKGTPPNHSYKAYLGDKLLGTLVKDGDGIYKLKYNEVLKTKAAKELEKTRVLKIVYEKESVKQTLLIGEFS